MKHTRGGTIKSYLGSDLCHKIVRFQEPMGDMSKVLDARLQHVFTETALDQLAANGTDVNRHHRKLKNKQYVALPAIENQHSHCIPNSSYFRPMLTILLFGTSKFQNLSISFNNHTLLTPKVKLISNHNVYGDCVLVL